MKIRSIGYFIPLVLIFHCLVSCSNDNQDKLPGYIEGEYTYIAGGVAGTLFNLNVARGQSIQKGDFLYALDPQPELAFMEASKDNIGEFQAQVEFAKLQLTRQQGLYKSNATSLSSLDEAQKNFHSLEKQLQSTQKAYVQAQWSLQQKNLRSPVTGRVFDVFYRVGEKVTANQPVLAVITAQNINALFYMPEELVSTIHLGQVISLGCDGCTQLVKAKIVYISPEAEYTPPIIYGENTRHSLVYLVRAAMPAPVAVRFHIGQPIDIYFHE